MKVSSGDSVLDGRLGDGGFLSNDLQDDDTVFRHPPTVTYVATQQ